MTYEGWDGWEIKEEGRWLSAWNGQTGEARRYHAIIRSPGVTVAEALAVMRRWRGKRDSTS